MMIQRLCSSMEVYKERIVFSAYVSLLCGMFGCLSAGFLPFWSDLGDGKRLGVFTLVEGFHPQKMEPRRIRYHLRIVNLVFQPKMEWATEYYGVPTWMYGLGLAVCLANAILSSVQACCLKSSGYKLCYASGSMGLLSVVLFSSTMISFLKNTEKNRLSWALLLAFLSTVFILLASILYFIGGRRNYFYSKMPSNRPDEVI